MYVHSCEWACLSICLCDCDVCLCGVCSHVCVRVIVYAHVSMYACACSKLPGQLALRRI